MIQNEFFRENSGNQRVADYVLQVLAGQRVSPNDFFPEESAVASDDSEQEWASPPTTPATSQAQYRSGYLTLPPSDEDFVVRQRQPIREGDL